MQFTDKILVVLKVQPLYYITSIGQISYVY